MIAIRDAVLATLLAGGVFWGARSVSASLDGPERHNVAGALQKVQAPGAALCLAGRDCLSPNADRTLFVFLRTGDCAGGMYDAAVLQELYDGTPRARLNVVGVVDGMSEEEVRAFAVASGITYPLYRGSSGLQRYVPNPRSDEGNRPMKLLVGRDGSELGRWTSVTVASALRGDAQRLRRYVLNADAAP